MKTKDTLVNRQVSSLTMEEHHLLFNTLLASHKKNHKALLMLIGQPFRVKERSLMLKYMRLLVRDTYSVIPSYEVKLLYQTLQNTISLKRRTNSAKSKINREL